MEVKDQTHHFGNKKPPWVEALYVGKLQLSCNKLERENYNLASFVPLHKQGWKRNITPRNVWPLLW